MIDKILVPIDGSEYADNALNFAIELAKKFSSEVSIAHIVPTTTAFITGPEFLGPSLLLDLRKQLEESGSRILKSGEDRVKNAGIKVTTKMSYGNPADKIIKIANEEGISLIVMGNRGLGSVARFFLGSVSDRVTHHSTCPVLIVKS